MPTRNRIVVVAPLLLGVALILLSTVLSQAAAVLWISATVLFGIAAVAAFNRSGSSRARKSLLVATAFVVAAALGVGITLQATNSVSTAGVPAALQLTRADAASVTTAAVKKREVTWAGDTKVASAKAAASSIDEVLQNQGR
jgi:thiol:disulfide interchange protein